MSLALVYIARGIDAGVDASRAFIDSYKLNDPGVEHQLYVATKGWESESAFTEVKELFDGISAVLISVPDDGFDWGVYIRLAKELQEDRICFLNSHSTPRVPNWLCMLNKGLDDDCVGAIGATASLSTWSFSKPYWAPNLRYTLQYPFRLARELFRYCRYSKDYQCFPNPHLRSNAFLIRRELFCEFCGDKSVPIVKSDSHILESGRRGLSMFLLSKQLKTSVCGADGVYYPTNDWMKSKTFRVDEQQNLLIEDNQTRIYQRASNDLRSRLTFKSWQTGGCHEP